MFQNRKNLVCISWVAKINKKWWMKNTEVVIRIFPQCYNIYITCLTVLGNQSVSGQATSWNANSEICSRYSFIRWYQFLSI